MRQRASWAGLCVQEQGVVAAASRVSLPEGGAGLSWVWEKGEVKRTGMLA